MKERANSDEFSGEKIKESPDDMIKFEGMGIDFLGGKTSDTKIKRIGGFDEKGAAGNSGFQELTLSYLCENSKLEKENFSAKNMFENVNGSRYKGKEVAVSEDQVGENNNNNNSDMWVERDFLQLNENRGKSLLLAKREAEYVETQGENKEKKSKVESLNLSLALPDVSLSLAGSNRLPDGDFPSRLRQTRSLQSLGPSNNNNTQATYSNDFTAASLSYTCSHPFSHNLSCSMTRNSTDNNDQIWNCGEGTNGSVHSRFRPIGDGSVALSNHGAGGGFAMGNFNAYNKDSCNNSLYKAASSDNHSFFPSELPARPRIEAQSGDSKGRGLDSFKGSEDLDERKTSRLSRPERIAREIVSESVPVMSQIIQELTDETAESVKEYLKDLISNPIKKDDLVGLQKRLERRCDLSRESLSKCPKTQLEILVAIKMGLASFLSSKNRLPAAELVETFLLERCRNINCRRVLPVDDCDCKICSTKKGFCSECMCPVCLNFDCASNTCSWVGCDVCSHWSHAACGLQKNLIKPGPSLKGMQFHCLGCGHASEMFGFVKDVFMSCAQDWGPDALLKELDCVRRIFRGSEDRKEKQLQFMANEMVAKIENKRITPPEVCNLIFKFFNSGLYDAGSSKDFSNQPSFGKDASAVPLPNNPTPKASSLYNNVNSSIARHELMPFDFHQNNDLKFSDNNDKIIEDEWSVKPTKKDGFDSLESLVRIKEAEARMFQSRADEARREVESFRRMVRMETDKLEQEYGGKLANLCLKETEERQRKKLEELKVLENSHCDYYKMKIRMQAEISGLLKRMETTKQQIV